MPVAALAARLGGPGLVIVDCRHVLADPAAGERAWREARLPGARFAHLDRDLSGHDRPATEGRHPLPAEADFLATLGRLGITPGATVVAYDAGDGAMAAARLWWLLDLLGHRDAYVLDGGLAAWQAAGLPLDTGAPAPVRAAAYPGRFDRSRLATADDVAARAGEAPGWLLDARAPERFRGEVEPIDRVAGHIPGAVNRPYAANLSGQRLRPAGVLRAEFAALTGGRAPGEVVLSCGSGVTACHLALAMAHAGLPGARIYAPSWSGWIADPAHPVATGP